MGDDVIKNTEKWPNFLILNGIFERVQKYTSRLFDWPHWGFFVEGLNFLESLKLKNPYKITSSLSKAIRYLKNM